VAEQILATQAGASAPWDMRGVHGNRLRQGATTRRSFPKWTSRSAWTTWRSAGDQTGPARTFGLKLKRNPQAGPPTLATINVARQSRTHFQARARANREQNFTDRLRDRDLQDEDNQPACWMGIALQHDQGRVLRFLKTRPSNQPTIELNGPLRPAASSTLRRLTSVPGRQWVLPPEAHTPLPQ
jgi:hypothetical protein